MDAAVKTMVNIIHWQNVAFRKEGVDAALDKGRSYQIQNIVAFRKEGVDAALRP